MNTFFIEGQDDLKSLRTKLREEDVFLYVVAGDVRSHPVVNTPCVMFAKGLTSKNVFIIPFNHVDAQSSVSLKEVCDIINTVAKRKFVIDKKTFWHLTAIDDTIDINILSYLIQNEIIDDSVLPTSAHRFYHSQFPKCNILNRIIPINKHLEKFQLLVNFAEDLVSKHERELKEESFTKMNTELTYVLTEIEKSGLKVDRNIFLDNFGDHRKHLVSDDDMVYTNYSMFTSTGRPSNSFGGVNYAALSHDGSVRMSFISRHGKDGKLVDMDFTAFHPHLIANLVRYNLTADVDIYAYLGRYYFNTDSLSNIQIKQSKNLTFKQLYGRIVPEYKDIPYFKKVQEFIDQRWNFYKENGYIETPIYNRKINKQMLGESADANKVFNFLLQSFETEVALSTAYRVLQYMKGKKSKMVLYTYDSMLFDFHRDDGQETLMDIKHIMTNNDKYPIKVKLGDNYKQLEKFNF